jgi:hypothetical protein
MKRLLVMAVLVVTALGFSVTTGVAAASGTTVAHYNVSYIDPVVGPVNCTGVHQYGKNFPGTATTGGQDSFICTSTTGVPLTGVTPNQVLTQPFLGVGWWSDYFIQLNGSHILATSFSGTVSGSGTSFTAVAGYF